MHNEPNELEALAAFVSAQEVELQKRCAAAGFNYETVRTQLQLKWWIAAMGEATQAQEERDKPLSDLVSKV